MAEKRGELIFKTADGALRIVAVCDREGNDIPNTYAKKTELGSFRVYRDAEGYPCYEETTQGGQ